MKTGSRGKVRITSMKAVKWSCSTGMKKGIEVREVLEALPGLPAFTGCDSVSAFAGKGKVKAFKDMTKNPMLVQLFNSLGSDWTVTEDLYELTEQFVCHLWL